MRSAFGTPATLLWPPASAPLLPSPGEVVLVAADLQVEHERLSALAASLSPGESARAARFATDELRARWTAARGMLRSILGAALGLPPASLQFRVGEHGKPSLDPRAAPALAGDPLTFNLSHSDRLMLLALARTREVGVDLEHMRDRRSDEVARRFFCPREWEALSALPPAARVEAFFRTWSAKEAFMKATGLGLGMPLSSFEFQMGPRGPVSLSWHREDPAAPQKWSVHLLDLAAEYSAALVAERLLPGEDALALRTYRFP